jgi:hypothetical protein
MGVVPPWNKNKESLKIIRLTEKVSLNRRSKIIYPTTIPPLTNGVKRDQA